jgi:hypothetical protein
VTKFQQFGDRCPGCRIFGSHHKPRANKEPFTAEAAEQESLLPQKPLNAQKLRRGRALGVGGLKPVTAETKKAFYRRSR